MSTYIYREDSGYDEKFEAADETAAEKHGRELLASGDYGIITKTLRATAQVARIETDEDGEHELDWREVEHTFQPSEPKCEDGQEHDWQKGQSFSSGGGVKWTDTCTRCDLRRITDTWGHDPATGATMKTLAYERAA